MVSLAQGDGEQLTVSQSTDQHVATLGAETKIRVSLTSENREWKCAAPSPDTAISLREPNPVEAARPVLRSLTTRPRRIEVLQQWEGVITSVEPSSVWADLHDLTDPSNPTEIAEIPMKEFAVGDRPLIEPGSVFYWSIGHETTIGGQILRVSEIRVRRTPVWSQQALDRARSLGQQLYERFGSQSADAAQTR